MERFILYVNLVLIGVALIVVLVMLIASAHIGRQVFGLVLAGSSLLILIGISRFRV